MHLIVGKCFASDCLYSKQRLTNYNPYELFNYEKLWITFRYYQVPTYCKTLLHLHCTNETLISLTSIIMYTGTICSMRLM